MVYNYFRPVHPALTAVILIGFVYLFPAISFWPDLLPSASISLWFVQNYQSAIRNLFFLVLILHLFEAVFAMMICTYMDLEHGITLKWGLSVFINGVFALRYLISRLFDYECEQRKQADIFAAASNNYDTNGQTYFNAEANGAAYFNSKRKAQRSNSRSSHPHEE